MLFFKAHSSVIILFIFVQGFAHAGDWIKTINNPEPHEVVIISPPPKPIYPHPSRMTGEVGRVEVVLLVGVDGSVMEAKPVSIGAPRLKKSCADAMSQMVFQPLKREGILYRFKVIKACTFLLSPIAENASAVHKGAE